MYLSVLTMPANAMSGWNGKTNLLRKYLFNFVCKAIRICRKDLTIGFWPFSVPFFFSLSQSHHFYFRMWFPFNPENQKSVTMLHESSQTSERIKIRKTQWSIQIYTKQVEYRNNQQELANAIILTVFSTMKDYQRNFIRFCLFLSIRSTNANLTLVSKDRHFDRLLNT